MKVTTDLPFKTDIHAIIIIKNLPVLQCGNCSEYLIEDNIMQRVDDIISNMNRGAEVEILNFAA
jgi:YgiT-type zinc finger domain-containing protein